jgi:hypothetical protein
MNMLVHAVILAYVAHMQFHFHADVPCVCVCACVRVCVHARAKFIHVGAVHVCIYNICKCVYVCIYTCVLYQT